MSDKVCCGKRYYGFCSDHGMDPASHAELVHRSMRLGEVERQFIKFELIVKSARALAAQLDVVHEDPEYTAIFTAAHVRGQPYEGATYVAEFNALKALLGKE